MAGLYDNIHKKRKRIKRQKAEGRTPERMRKVGSKGAPTAKAFRQSAKQQHSSEVIPCQWLKVRNILHERRQSSGC
jgi:hypothetical protein